jgi:hypothetical protein
MRIDMHDDEAISSHPDYAYSGRYKEPPHGLWYVIWAESGITEFPEDYTYYSLRHTYPTYRLQLGNVDVFILVQGNGVQCEIH